MPAMIKRLHAKKPLNALLQELTQALPRVGCAEGAMKFYRNRRKNNHSIP
jgi:hypothetical protein